MYKVGVSNKLATRCVCIKAFKEQGCNYKTDFASVQAKLSKVKYIHTHKLSSQNGETLKQYGIHFRSLTFKTGKSIITSDVIDDVVVSLSPPPDCSLSQMFAWFLLSW